jgi:hypothetical protein
MMIMGVGINSLGFKTGEQYKTIEKITIRRLQNLNYRRKIPQ